MKEDPFKPGSTARRAAARTEAIASPLPGARSVSSNIAAGQTEFEFVCPICLTTEFKLQHSAAGPSGKLHCPRCAREFAKNATYADLTVNSGAPQEVYRQRQWAGTELFRSPLVSFAYERGWRQGFRWAGFPGVDQEFDLAMGYLLPAAAGKVVVDMSCGSGLFARRFAASGRFAGVVAADFSESMLVQARQYFQQSGGAPATAASTRAAAAAAAAVPVDPSRYVLVRADVGRLPFATGSVAGLHAGAALHCWPNPAAAFAEISRVLAPGGVFVASTFLTATAPLGEVVGDAVVRPLAQFAPRSSTYRWWEEAEIKDLCSAVGLQDFQRHRSRQFILFAARKPGGGPEQR
ncbi:hypothetical protein N2152v2_007261 [Parachlorella kessleri]